eukprot:2198090-Rhodomonas_salina.1
MESSVWLYEKRGTDVDYGATPRMVQTHLYGASEHVVLIPSMVLPGSLARRSPMGLAVSTPGPTP